MSGDRGQGKDLLNRWQDLVQEYHRQHERLQRERQEIQTLTSQVREELESLERDWESLQNRLQHMRSHPDSYGKEEIVQTYDAALKQEERLAALRESHERLEGRTKEREEQIRLLGHFVGLAEEVTRQLFPPEPEAEGDGAKGPRAEGAATGPHGGRWLIYSLESQEHRQRALARRMHDGPAQALTNLMLQAEICERLLSVDAEQAARELETLRQLVLETFGTVRDYIAELRPMSLDDLGLVPTVKKYAEIASQRREVPVTLNLVGEDRRLSPLVESTLFRAAQELVSNALEYAAASRVEVNIEIGAETVSLEVEDDGQGFDVQQVLKQAPARGTWGLIGLRERIGLLGGEFDIQSRKGQGTTARVTVPAEFAIEEPAAR